MSETVYFASMRSLERAENIKAVYNAYHGKKQFVQMDWNRYIFNSGVIVTDEFISYAGIGSDVIMIGHGIPGLKYFGYHMRARYVREEEARNFSWVICSGKETIGLVAAQHGVDPSMVLPLGMPRTDQFFQMENGGTILQEAKRSYLYVPTWRNGTDAPEPEVDYDLIDSLLEDGEVFAVKPHMLSGGADLEGYKHIITISQDEESSPYLMDADVVITDYSAILMDAHVLRKPVVLFAKDVSEYNATRGIYYNYPSGYSSNHAKTEAELVQMMRTAKRGPEDEECRRRCCESCDGHSTDRLIALINKCLEWRTNDER